MMERESFEDEATAQLLNSNFVSIKVDREERPDVDKVYVSNHPSLQLLYGLPQASTCACTSCWKARYAAAEWMPCIAC